MKKIAVLAVFIFSYAYVAPLKVKQKKTKSLMHG